MTNCTHTRTIEAKWIENPDYDPYYDDDYGYWEEAYEQYTYQDIDIHRYRCTQCGEIKYYSERGRKLFEGDKV
jgi:hypothetical protein